MKYSKCLSSSGFFTHCNKTLCARHHIFGGADRKKSEKYGMKVFLHPKYHTEFPDGVHCNEANNLKVKLYGYNKFKEMYPELEFRDIFSTAWMMGVDDSEL